MIVPDLNTITQENLDILIGIRKGHSRCHEGDASLADKGEAALWRLQKGVDEVELLWLPSWIPGRTINGHTTSRLYSVHQKVFGSRKVLLASHSRDRNPNRQLSTGISYP